LNRKKDIYGGRDPRDIPAYTIPEVAQYISLPVSRVRYWLSGTPRTTSEEKTMPVIVAADPAKQILSFTNLTEIHVLSLLRSKNVKLSKVRSAIDYLSREFETDHPLAELQISTDRTDIFVEKFDELINASLYGQIPIREIVELYLERIERDKQGRPICFYPFTRRDIAKSPKLVSIDPRRRFGRPYLTEGGIETWVIASRYIAGDSISSLVDDYNVSMEAIEEAIRYETELKRAA
jgi:uncharacterized protein (DUF433 family)